MTKPEMTRRINSIANQRTLEEAHRMVLQGYGSHGMTLECNVTLKQANAVCQWVEHYGRIIPRIEVAA